MGKVSLVASIPHMRRTGDLFIFLKSLIAMKRLKYCGKCIHLKYEDAEGYGWCDLWEEADVNRKDEACVEYEDDEHKEYDYE